jgi:hypothetical protein
MTVFSAKDVGQWMATELDQNPKDELRYEEAVRGNDGVIWPHCDALNWPHPHACL